MPIGRIEVFALKVRGCWQHNIAMLHALGHCDVDAHTEDLLAAESPPHSILIRMNNDRIVVVDEKSSKWRVDIIPLEMATNIHNIQGSCPRRNEIRSGQPGAAF